MEHRQLFDDAFIDLPWDQRADFVRQYLDHDGRMPAVAVGATLDEHSLEWLWVLLVADGTMTHMEYRRFVYIPLFPRFEGLTPEEHLAGVHMLREARTKDDPSFPKHWCSSFREPLINCVLHLFDKLHVWSANAEPSRVDPYMGGQLMDIVSHRSCGKIEMFSTFTGAVYSDGTEGIVIIDRLLRFLQREPPALRRAALIYRFMSWLSRSRRKAK